MLIAIPSYDRYNIKTLDYLEKENVDKSFITIFVVDTEYDIYKKNYPEYNIIIGELGICNQRNFITNYYNDGDLVICMDDDIKSIIHLQDKPFLIWINECLTYMKDKNIGLLGVTSSTNIFWKKQSTAPDFQIKNFLCVGVFHIYKVIKSIQISFPFLEDYHRSCLYIKLYGGIIKYNPVVLQTTYWSKGGCKSNGRNEEIYVKSVNDLLNKYPDLLTVSEKLIPSLNKTKKLPNIRIKKN